MDAVSRICRRFLLAVTTLSGPLAPALCQAPAATSPGTSNPPTLEQIGSTAVPFELAVETVIDPGEDGKEHVLTIGSGGEVRTLDPNTGAFRGKLQLPDPAHSLVCVRRFAPGQPLQLVVYASDGLRAYAWRDGAFRAPGVRLLRRGRFQLRVGKPQLTDFVQDVNGDQRADLVLPGSRSCTLYLQTGDGPKFQRASEIQVEVQSSSTIDNARLSTVLDHRIVIPDLQTLDVNGDQRRDLIAVVEGARQYHLQRKDGTFPRKPDVTLDLRRFRDTTPKAELEFGRTLANDQALLHSKDLDGDGIPDYVIAHRRKVWVYHGTDQGPQFEKPSKILILADDVTFLVLLHLDEDAFPDLLAFKLAVPTVATLFLGLFSQWDVTIKSVGYANTGGRSFARTPRWRSETTIRIPSIMSLIRNPEAIVERFTEVGKRFRLSVIGDLNGDRLADVLLQSEDKDLLQFWLLTAPGKAEERRADEEVRRLLFEEENKVWDVERILGLLGTMADDRTTRLTRGSPAAGSFPLRDPARFRLEYAAAVDFDGDGRSEVVLRYRSVTAPFASTIDLLRLGS